MDVYLVRHAAAVGEDVAGSDRDRWLDVGGRQAARRLAQLLRAHPVVPTAIVASPLPRAVQTAELLAEGLDFLGAIETWRSLEPAAQPAVAARRLAELGGCVIAVSHEPMVSLLGGVIVGRPSFPPFRTAQACSLVDRQPAFSFRGDSGQTAALFVE